MKREFQKARAPRSTPNEFARGNRRQRDLPASEATLPDLNLAAGTLLVFFFLVMFGPYITFKPAPFTGEGSPARQVAYIITFLTSAYALRAHLFPVRFLCVPLPIVLALTWCLVSLAWAIVPDIAMRRLLLTMLIIWIIFMLVSQLGFLRTTNVLRLCCMLLLVVNYLCVALIPNVGTHMIGEMLDPGLIGNWRGVLQQKNFAGAACAFTILIFVFAARHIHPYLRLVVVSAALFFLYKTSSKTSIGLLAGSLIVGWLYLRYDNRYRLVVLPLAMLAMIPCAIALQIYWDDLVAPFQRQDALTGRTQIWPFLLRFWDDHRWLGAGFGSFWNVGPDSPIHLMTSGWVSQLGNGHNGYIDLMVQTGVIGLILVVFAMILLPIFRVITNTRPLGHNGALVLAVICFAAGHNMTETSLMERDVIVQVFLVFAVALAYHITNRHRQAALTEGQP